MNNSMFNSKLPLKPVYVMNNEELDMNSLMTRARKYQISQQYKLAIQAYSDVLEKILSGPPAQRRDVYLARSACYVAAGMPQEAVADADEAIALDQEWCSSYYQKAEAYFSNGQFEQAIINYYKAYQKRPDIEKFRLGVQKAENAITSAIVVCVPEPLNTEFDATSPTEEEIKSAILNPRAPNKSRCLCGCCGCDSRCCGDFKHNQELCQCVCAACCRHNLYKHNMIYEPNMCIYIRVSDLFKNEHAGSTTQTPIQNIRGNAPTAYRPGQTKKRQYAVGLAEDTEFIHQIEQEKVIQKNKRVNAITKESEKFISTKKNFWSQQGEGFQNTTKKAAQVHKTIKLQRTLPQRLGVTTSSLNNSQDLTNSQVIQMNNNELLQRIVQKISQAQTLLNQEDYQQATLIMQTIDKQAAQIMIDPEKDENYVQQNEKNKLLSDSFVMLGCIYFRMDQLELAVQSFGVALDYALEYKCIDDPKLSPSKPQQQIYMKQQIESRALAIRCYRVLYITLMELKMIDRAIQCLEELQRIDYLPYFKGYDLAALGQCYFDQVKEDDRGLLEKTVKVVQDALEVAFQEKLDFNIRKKYQVKVQPIGVKQFQEVAPSWLGIKPRSIKEVCYDGFWLLYNGYYNLSHRDGDQEYKKAIASLKDGLLLADRNGDKTQVTKFLNELKKYEDVE